MLGDIHTEACFRQGQKFDTAERVVRKVEFDVHSRIKRSYFRFRFADELGNGGAHLFLKPRMVFAGRLRRVIGAHFSALQFLRLDFEAF